MTYINANIFDGKEFKPGAFSVEDGKFTNVFGTPETGETTDLKGAYVIPGLIDIHTHGNSGADFSDGDLQGLTRMAEYYAKNGITSFAPANLTLPYDVLDKAFKTAKELHDNRPADCARVMGIQMEGPFFSEKKKGSQNAAYLRDPDFDAFKKLYDGCGGMITIADVAPELPGAVEFAEKAKELCTVSVAHTDATYDEAKKVFDAGATHLTHLYNAMPPIHHRKPGVIGAASENENVAAEVICDGLHVHESAIRMAFKLFPGRICLISDSLRCCGMPDGEYEHGGQVVYLQGGIAKLADGTIAGAATNLYDGMLNAVKFGIPVADAINAATKTPAGEIGRGDEIGSIENGKFADFVVCDEKLARKAVYIAGKKVNS